MNILKNISRLLQAIRGNGFGNFPCSDCQCDAGKVLE